MTFNITSFQQQLNANRTNLTEWNNYLAELYISLDVLLIIIIVVGIVGNGIVIYVYGYKIKKIKDGQYFIPYLAISDLIGSILCPLFVLSRTLMPVIYSSDILCKIGIFANSASIFVSVFLLFTIAIQRYVKICKGQGPINGKQKRYLVVFNCFWSIMLASPSLTSSGIVPIYSSYYNVTGQTCGSLPGLGPFIYDITLAIAIPVCCIGFTVIYILIAHKTIRSLNKSDRLHSGLYRIDSTGTVGNDQTRHTTLSPTESAASTTNIINKDRRFTLTRLQIRNKHIKSKITLMFMIITIAFIICSVPKYIILMFEKFKPGFWDKSTGVERLLLMFVNYGYIVLFIINPFVYAFHDHSFRTYLPKGIARVLSRRRQPE